MFHIYVHSRTNENSIKETSVGNEIYTPISAIGIFTYSNKLGSGEIEITKLSNFH